MKRLTRYPCSNPGCDTQLDIEARQIVVTVGETREAYCSQDCAEADETKVHPLAGVCPECGGELREWRKGEFQCAGPSGPEERKGCGFAWSAHGGRAA